MQQFEVRMSKPGGGSGSFTIVVNANTSDQARRSAEAQNPEFKAMAAQAVRG